MKQKILKILSVCLASLFILGAVLTPEIFKAQSVSYDTNGDYDLYLSIQGNFDYGFCGLSPNEDIFWTINKFEVDQTEPQFKIVQYIGFIEPLSSCTIDFNDTMCIVARNGGYIESLSSVLIYGSNWETGNSYFLGTASTTCSYGNIVFSASDLKVTEPIYCIEIVYYFSFSDFSNQVDLFDQNDNCEFSTTYFPGDIRITFDDPSDVEPPFSGDDFENPTDPDDDAGILDWLKQLWEWIKSSGNRLAEFGNKLAENFRANFLEFSSALADAFSHVMEDWKTFFTEILPSYFDAVFENHQNGILGGLNNLGLNLMNKIDTALDNFYENYIGIEHENTGNFFSDVRRFFTETIPALFEKTQDNTKEFWTKFFIPDEEELKEYFTNFTTFFYEETGALGECFGLVIDYFQSLVDVLSQDISPAEALEEFTFPVVNVPLLGSSFSFGGWSFDRLSSNQTFMNLFDICRNISSLAITIPFIFGLFNRFKSLLGGV